ncbi:MAG: cytidylate kinase-like family protein [Deltaproteobacteria bacterium]|nr:cytidylate kinase-like family protein [Deltaproteobacteria bacterium]
MAVITISRQFGAGGQILGQMLADELEYTFADNEIIQRLAREANVSSKWIKSFEKEAGGRLSWIISRLVSKRWLDLVLGGEYGYLDEKIYLDYMVLIIAQIADEGNAVIMGRGSQYILNDHPDAFHVLLIDEVETRIKFIVKQHGVTEGKAASAVNVADRRRLNLYGRLGKKDYDNPLLYHLVLNMGRLDLQSALKIICAMTNP